MTRYFGRVLGAAVLDKRTYEEVEADRQASAQAATLVVLSSVAGGIGLLGVGRYPSLSLRQSSDRSSAGSRGRH